MKIQAIKLLGGRCSICGYNKCIDALEFHHENPNEKEFKLILCLGKNIKQKL